MSKISYVVGADRVNPDEVKAHIYASLDGDYFPMCGYGWNRSDGTAFSILRGHGSAKGTCALCERNKAENRQPIIDGFPHKTRWL